MSRVPSYGLVKGTVGIGTVLIGAFSVALRQGWEEYCPPITPIHRTEKDVSEWHCRLSWLCSGWGELGSSCSRTAQKTGDVPVLFTHTPGVAPFSWTHPSVVGSLGPTPFEVCQMGWTTQPFLHRRLKPPPTHNCDLTCPGCPSRRHSTHRHGGISLPHVPPRGTGAVSSPDNRESPGPLVSRRYGRRLWARASGRGLYPTQTPLPPLDRTSSLTVHPTVSSGTSMDGRTQRKRARVEYEESEELDDEGSSDDMVTQTFCMCGEKYVHGDWSCLALTPCIQGTLS